MLQKSFPLLLLPVPRLDHDLRHPKGIDVIKEQVVVEVTPIFLTRKEFWPGLYRLPFHHRNEEIIKVCLPVRCYPLHGRLWVFTAHRFIGFFRLILPHEVKDII